MANLLYLVHRMPYPPDKGDKVRSYHLLRHLAARHRVFLGSFIDDPADAVHVDAVRACCADAHFVHLDPRRARIASLAGLATGEALSLRYYRDAGLARWVRRTVAERRIDAAVVFCSSVAPYAEGLGLPVLLDFVDVDSAKWDGYAQRHGWPLSWLYRREGLRLLAYERAACLRASRSFLSTDQEVALFEKLAPECAGRVESMGNGVDTDYFKPDPERESPYAPDELPVVFTGAMDYWPNVDAVTWFVQSMLPALRQRWPRLRFFVVGRSPDAAVRRLAGDAVVVTGTVPDVRPWLQHAAVVVAPLRLARGVQNKVLEAMAMRRPVVAAAGCAEVIGADIGRELIAAADAEGFVREVDALLRDADRAAAIGGAARARTLQDHAWDARLSVIDRWLAGAAVTPGIPLGGAVLGAGA